MFQEIELSSESVIEALRVLNDEVNLRISNGDGDIDKLIEVIEALGMNDRITIVEHD